jgi:hypothetical protein
MDLAHLGRNEHVALKHQALVDRPQRRSALLISPQSGQSDGSLNN